MHSSIAHNVASRVGWILLTRRLRDPWSVTRLAEELGGLVRGISFYRLTPGRLEQALDLVENTTP